MQNQTDDLSARLRQRKTLNVGILVFPDVEVLDFAGPFEVFSVAARVAARDSALSEPPFRVSTVAAERAVVTARHGLKVVPQFGFGDQPPIDLLVVPGGVVTQPLHCAATLTWVRAAAARTSVTAAVCTGAFILAKAGLLEGRAVTTHWEDIADLRRMFPRLRVLEGTPFVDEGAVVTSAGISAGIEMSLHLVGRTLGAALAQATARQMEYNWSPRL
jgi:transcriptional regulator GlxA family with amidase domain